MPTVRALLPGLLALLLGGCHLIFPFTIADPDAAALDGGPGEGIKEAAAADQGAPDAPAVAPDAGATGWVVSTLAGDGTKGLLEGLAATARFSAPYGVAVAPNGDVFVADTSNHRIRLIEGGQVSTFAGSGSGFQDGTTAQAMFSLPTGIAVGPADVVYVADRLNHRIRAIVGGAVTTLAGDKHGFLNGAAASARFSNPSGLAVDGAGAILVADQTNHKIRRIAGGIVSTLAGTSAGYLNGPPLAAKFDIPFSLAVEPGTGAIIVADVLNNRVRKITGTAATTIAGSGIKSFADGPAAAARFGWPHGVAVGSAGAVYVADSENHRIRMIQGGVVTTIAGTGVAGLFDGPGATARFNWPRGIAVDSAGVVYVADGSNHAIRTLVRAP